jgi:periplasmic protein TonB
MFETVVPETFAPRSKKVFYESLPVSIAIHAAAVFGILFASVWTVTFPDQSPKLTMLYSLVSELPSPPPPPPPPAAAPKVAVVQPTAQVQVPLDEITAPTVIPDEVPTEDLPIITEKLEGVVGGIEGGVAGGVVGGSPGGVMGGDIGGEHGGVVGSLSIAPPNTVVVERDKPLPMMAMSKVYPQYPEEARMRGWEDELIVRYTIGKDGRVKTVEILDNPERPLFTDTTVKAIRHWRFRPLMKDGQAQEVVHELTVYFRLES